MFNLRLSTSKTDAFKEACLHGHINVVHYLTDTKRLTYADINADGHKGLRLACEYKHTAIVEYLLQHPLMKIEPESLLTILLGVGDVQYIRQFFPSIRYDISQKFIKKHIATIAQDPHLIDYFLWDNEDNLRLDAQELATLSIEQSLLGLAQYCYQHPKCQDGFLSALDTVSTWLQLGIFENNSLLRFITLLPEVQSKHAYHVLMEQIFYESLHLDNLESVEFLLFSPDVPYEIQQKLCQCMITQENVLTYMENQDFQSLKIYMRALKCADILSYMSQLDTFKAYCKNVHAMEIFKDVEDFQMIQCAVEETSLIL